MDLLIGGFDFGPLFAPPPKRRPPKPKPRGWENYHRRHEQRTPPWADPAATAAVYARAKALTKETGVLHEVDHIVPLNHPRVCGLHWHVNLQVLDHEANRRKGNNWCPEQMELFA